MNSHLPNGLAGLLSVAFLALFVGNGIWAFRDARSRGRSGFLVAMLVLVTFPAGVVLWLAFRPGPVDETKIPNDPDHELKRRANAGTL